MVNICDSNLQVISSHPGQISGDQTSRRTAHNFFAPELFPPKKLNNSKVDCTRDTRNVYSKNGSK